MINLRTLAIACAVSLVVGLFGGYRLHTEPPTAVVQPTQTVHDVVVKEAQQVVRTVTQFKAVPGTCKAEVATVTKEVITQPRESRDDSFTSTSPHIDATKPTYQLGLSCNLAGCLDYRGVGVLGAMRLGNTDLHLFTHIIPLKSYSVGVSYDF